MSVCRANWRRGWFRRPGVFLPRDRGCCGLCARGAVVRQLMGMDAGQQFGAAPDVETRWRRSARIGRFCGRIDVGGRNQIGAQQVGDLLGVDAVVLVFAAVDGLEIERMGQDESEARLLAGIGQPIPAEHAFAADGEVVTIGFDEFKEELEVVVFDIGVDQLLALPIHDADVHLAGMQIDSAVELGGGGVILHTVIIGSGAAKTPVLCSVRGEC